MGDRLLYDSVFSSKTISSNMLLHFDQYFTLLDINMNNDTTGSREYINRMDRIEGRRDIHMKSVFKSRDIYNMIHDIVNQMIVVDRLVYDLHTPNITIHLLKDSFRYNGFVLLIKNDDSVVRKDSMNVLNSIQYAMLPLNNNTHSDFNMPDMLMRHDSLNLKRDHIIDIKKDIEMYGSSNDNSYLKQTINMIDNNGRMRMI